MENLTQESIRKQLKQYYSYDDVVQKMINENYVGIYDSRTHFAEEYFKSVNEIPYHLEDYIDYDLIQRDLFVDDFISFHDKNFNVHVFKRLK